MSDGNQSSPTVLVTGASGQFGRVLRYGLEQYAPDLSVVYHGRTARQMSGGSWRFLDIQASFDEWVDLIKSINPHIILHLAGVTHTQNVPEHMMKQLNANCTVKIAQAAESVGVRHFFFASSAAIYGAQPDDVPFHSEVGPTAPISAYGRSKHAAEEMLACTNFVNMGVTALRYATTAGSDQLLLNALGKRVDTPLTLHKFDNGHGAERSYLGPRDLGQYHSKLFSSGIRGKTLPPALNIATPGQVFMDEFLDQISYQSGRVIPWSWTKAPDEAIKRCVLSTKLLNQTVGYSKRLNSLQDLAEQALAFFNSDYCPAFGET